ncbi:MAG: hypothetical protein RIQ38_1075 [Pseudomonadota bacterium]|jgi:putative lipoic acid-binding regulatory protein
MTSTPNSPTAAPEQASLIEYPCVFPIKVMGLHVEGFTEALVELARVHDPLFDASTIEHRPSSTGKYMGVTLHINATSRVQLDAVYGALTSHPMVKVVL